jgi:aspartate/glutamate racemase
MGHRTRIFLNKNYDAYLLASNTAHIMWSIYSALGGLTRANILNMVQQVAQVTKQAVSAVPNGKVLILSTDRTWEYKLYSKAFAELGIPYIDFFNAAEGSSLPFCLSSRVLTPVLI